MDKHFTSLKFVMALCLLAACARAKAADGTDLSEWSSRRVARSNDADSFTLRSGGQNRYRDVVVTQASPDGDADEPQGQDGQLEGETIPAPDFGTTIDPEYNNSMGNSMGDGAAPCETCGQPGNCCRCCLCGPPGRFWLRAEYVGWWATGSHVPVLVTSSPDGSLPGTPLYGGATYNNTYRPGLWTQGGMWLDCCRNWGLVGDYFLVGRQNSPFTAFSDGEPVLGRPFTDANTGEPSEQLIASPNTVVGRICINNYNSLLGAGAALRHNMCCWTGCNAMDQGCGRCFYGQDCCRLDWIAGFRYLQFNDNLGVNEQLTSIDQTTGVPVGTVFDVSDSFRTINNFYGWELGLVLDRYRGRWMYELGARVALGSTRQTVAINGSTVVSFPGQPTAVNEGGLLALSSNIGKYTHNSFSAIPIVSARLGYRVTPRLTLLVGYTALYWNNVARAGDQIDTTVNPNLLPPPVSGGPNRPAFNLHLSDLFLQGITLGGEIYF